MRVCVARDTSVVATGRLWMNPFRNAWLANQVPSGRLLCRATLMRHARRGRRRPKLCAWRESNCKTTELLFRIARVGCAVTVPSVRKICRRVCHGGRTTVCAMLGMSLTTLAMQRTIGLVSSAPRAYTALTTCPNVGAPRRCNSKAGSVGTR